MPFEALLAAWVGGVSVVSYLQFFWDKWCALRGRWRISEATLLGTALIGGALGAKIGQRAFRHKTRKQPFGRELNAAVMFNIAAVGLLLWPPSREAILGLFESSGR